MFILTILLVAIILIGLFINRRLNDLEIQVDEIGKLRPARREFETLLLRVDALESANRARDARPEPAETTLESEPPVPPARKEDVSARMREMTNAVLSRTHEPVSEDKPFPAPTEVIRPPAPPTWQHVAFSPPEPGPGDRIRSWMGNEEWETLVGGSWLNKIGAVVLVIGIALFLGYSFGHVGPAGRASVAILLSAALLVSGVRTEKRPRFKVFSRGLIGAGWAAFYATAYAIYAVPATRIIGSPFVGSIILLGVACGMILHSLRYRVQAITGITYFAAFAALAITPATPFAVLSLIPIAASILYLAWKFDWYGMALFGVVATYLTCISKGDANASLAGSQGLLLAYWLLFECFDWLRMRRRAVSGGVEWIFPANALGFLGMSYMAWAAHSPAQLWLAAGYASALYLTSGVVRFQVRPPASFETSQPLAVRLSAGGFEGATLIAAVLAGMAIFGRVTGVWSSFALALEAELIYLAGVAFGSAFLRGTGVGAFTISLLSLAAAANYSSCAVVLGHPFWNWSPGALLHAALFYINREIRRRGAVFSTVAAALIGFVVAMEVPQEWAGTAWSVFGILLLCVGLNRRLFEFRVQGYVLAAGGFLWTSGLSIAGTSLAPIDRPWMPLAVCLSLACIVTGLLTVAIPESSPGFTGPREHSLAVLGSTSSTVVLSLLLLWRVVPADYLGIAWCFLAVAFLELGLRRLPAAFRIFFLPMTGLTAIAIAATHGADLVHLPPFYTWATYLVACMACVTSAVRLSSKQYGLSLRQDGGSSEGTFARNLICVPGTVCASILIWLIAPLSLISLVWMLIAISLVELFRRFRIPVLAQIAISQAALAYGRVLFVDLDDTSRTWNIPIRLLTIPLFIVAMYWLRAHLVSVERRGLALATSWSALGPFLALTLLEAKADNVAVCWMAGSLALLIYGTLRNDRDFRLQSWCLAGLSLLTTAWFDLSPTRLLVSIPVVAALYAGRLILRREQDRYAPMCFSLAATVLLAAILYNSVSGHMLTVAWGAEGLVLLSTGFAVRDRLSRLQGLALLLLCTLKLFFYDLRNLDTPYRILSFIVLGLMLLGVSWTYSRFREQVRKIL